MEYRESLVRRAGELRLTARALAKTMKQGAFRSRYQGKGIDFAGVRDYLPGDDVRSIDWNVTARMGKPYVKLFDEERELPVFVVIDCSRSMCTPEARQYTAFETASLLVLAAEYNNSPAGALLFDKTVLLSIPPESTRSQALLLLSRFDRFGAVDSAKRCAGSDLGKALQGAAKVLQKRSLVFVISDFRTVDWEQSLRLLALRHDVLAVITEDPRDSALPPSGLIPFRDPESGALEKLPTKSAAFRDEWLALHRERRKTLKARCLRYNAKALFLSTGDDTALKLNTYFSS